MRKLLLSLYVLFPAFRWGKGAIAKNVCLNRPHLRRYRLLPSSPVTFAVNDEDRRQMW
jgi:hypothetical protein